MRPYLLLLLVFLSFTGIHCKKDHDDPIGAQAQLQGRWQLISQGTWPSYPGQQTDTTILAVIQNNVWSSFKADSLTSRDTFNIVYANSQADKTRYPCIVYKNGDPNPHLAFTIKQDTLTIFTINVIDGGSFVYVRERIFMTDDN